MKEHNMLPSIVCKMIIINMLYIFYFAISINLAFSFDYSQMEVRVFLSYLHNEEMDELLNRDDVDFHSESAKIAFGIKEEHPEFKFYRQMAKNITFGILYGLGNKRLAQQLSTTTDQAKAYKQQYFNKIHGS